MAAVGIDFGTAFMKVAVVEGDRVRVVKNKSGSRAVRACVTFQGGQRLVGEPSRAQKAGKEIILENVKRVLGRTYQSVCEDDPPVVTSAPIESDPDLNAPRFVIQAEDSEERVLVSPEEISSLMLNHLRCLSEDRLKLPVKRVVVAVPAYFNASQRQAVKHAAVIGGLEVMSLINETSATALAYAAGITGQRTAVIVDIGAGGGCASLVQATEGRVVVLATSGPLPGGECFNAKMMRHFAAVIWDKYKKNLYSESAAQRILRHAWEEAKQELSVYASVDLNEYLPGLDKVFKMEVTRMKFESNCWDIIFSLNNALQSILDQAKMSRKHVDDIVLVGGSSKLPVVESIVCDYFNTKELVNLDRTESVAIGAAMYAAVLSELEPFVDRFSLSDVLTLQLTVHCGLDSQHLWTFEQNRSLPASQIATIPARDSAQSTIIFQVDQGGDSNFFTTISYLKMTRKSTSEEADFTVVVCNDGSLSFVPGQNMTLELSPVSNLSAGKVRLLTTKAESLLQCSSVQVEGDRLVAIRSLENKCYELLPVAAKASMLESLLHSTLKWARENPDRQADDYEQRLELIEGFASKNSVKKTSPTSSCRQQRQLDQPQQQQHQRWRPLSEPRESPPPLPEERRHQPHCNGCVTCDFLRPVSEPAATGSTRAPSGAGLCSLVELSSECGSGDAAAAPPVKAGETVPVWRSSRVEAEKGRQASLSASLPPELRRMAEYRPPPAVEVFWKPTWEESWRVPRAMLPASVERRLAGRRSPSLAGRRSPSPSLVRALDCKSTDPLPQVGGPADSGSAAPPLTSAGKQEEEEEEVTPEEPCSGPADAARRLNSCNSSDSHPEMIKSEACDGVKEADEEEQQRSLTHDGTDMDTPSIPAEEADDSSSVDIKSDVVDSEDSQPQELPASGGIDQGVSTVQEDEPDAAPVPPTDMESASSSPGCNSSSSSTICACDEGGEDGCGGGSTSPTLARPSDRQLVKLVIARLQLHVLSRSCTCAAGRQLLVLDDSENLPNPELVKSLVEHQNEVLKSMAEATLLTIMSEVRDAGVMCLLVDTTFTVAHGELVSLMLRYCLPNGDIVERLIGLEDARSATGAGLFQRFTSLCDLHQVDWTQALIGVGMDAARSSKGACGELLDRLKKRAPRVKLTWNRWHRVEDLVLQAWEDTVIGLEFLGTILGLRDFFRVPERASIFAAAPGCDEVASVVSEQTGTLTGLVAFLLENLAAVGDVLVALKKADIVTASLARHLLSDILETEFVAVLVFAHEVLQQLRPLAQALAFPVMQSKTSKVVKRALSDLEKLEGDRFLEATITKAEARGLPKCAAETRTYLRGTLRKLAKATAEVLTPRLADSRAAMRDVDVLSLSYISFNYYQDRFFSSVHGINKEELEEEVKQAKESVLCLPDDTLSPDAAVKHMIHQLSRRDYHHEFPNVYAGLLALCTLPLLEGRADKNQLRVLRSALGCGQHPALEAAMILTCAATTESSPLFDSEVAIQMLESNCDFLQ